MQVEMLLLLNLLFGSYILTNIGQLSSYVFNSLVKTVGKPGVQSHYLGHHLISQHFN